MSEMFFVGNDGISISSLMFIQTFNVFHVRYMSIMYDWMPDGSFGMVQTRVAVYRICHLSVW